MKYRSMLCNTAWYIIVQAFYTQVFLHEWLAGMHYLGMHYSCNNANEAIIENSNVEKNGGFHTCLYFHFRRPIFRTHRQPCWFCSSLRMRASSCFQSYFFCFGAFNPFSIRFRILDCICGSFVADIKLHSTTHS